MASQKNKFLDIVFLPLDLDIEPYVEQIKLEVLEAYKNFSFWSTYQSCWMLPIWTSAGGLKEKELIEKGLDFSWTSAAQKMPCTKKFIENIIFPNLAGNYRVVVLITPPQSEIKLHVDCDYEDILSLTHKLRFSIAGNIDFLWFLNENLQKVHVPAVSRSYIIDGSHPHGVDASADQYKITICVGSPWSGQLEGNFLDLMVRSEEKFSRHVLSRQGLGRPVFEDIFIKKFREAESQGAEDPRDKYIKLIRA
jgi:hypothetical protein